MRAYKVTAWAVLIWRHACIDSTSQSQTGIGSKKLVFFRCTGLSGYRKMVTPADLMVENKHYGIDIASQDTNTCHNQEQPRLSSTAFKNNFVCTKIVTIYHTMGMEAEPPGSAAAQAKTQHMCVVFDWHIDIYL